MPSRLSSIVPADAHVLVVASSLSEGSRSQQLARIAQAKLLAAKAQVTLLDLAADPLPHAGSGAAWGDPAVARMQAATTAATHVVFAVPVYNYDVNSVAKNFVELMGEDALGGKTVGFVCSAGGQGSYMSVLSFANSLMLDFRCWIVPRFVYVTDDFEAGKLPKAMDERMDGLLHDLLSRGLAPA